MRSLQGYITHHHGVGLSDPRYLQIYLALATLPSIFVSATVWLILILTVFAQFHLEQLGVVIQVLAFGGLYVMVDFHRHKNLARLLGLTVVMAITMVSAVAWYLGPIVSAVAWLFDIPALAIFLLGPRRGMFAIAAAFVCVGLAFKFGVATPFVADEFSILMGHTINVIGATLILVLQLNAYEKSRRAMLREMGELNRELKVSSVTDRLTGLFNRGKLDQALTYEVARSVRGGQPLSVILMDLDYFKRVNDEYGHSIGDDFLVDFADLLRQVSRDIDVVGRWGGEEFLLICTNTALDGAVALAERFRAMVEQHVFATVGHKTVSLGVSTYRPGEDVRTLLVRADKALYRAKHAGRNRVISEAN